jgi:hypothetical protein
MEDVSKLTSVTWGPFAVSTTSGAGIEGCTLNVRRQIEVSEACARRHGYHETSTGGKRRISLPVVRRPFASHDAARQWAFVHGYIQRYFTDPELRARRVRSGS